MSPSSHPEARTAARRAAEAAARASYGRILASVAARTRDISAAEDALAEAFAIALRVWPDTGIPDAPDAWLITAARREAGRGARRHRTAETHQDMLTLLHSDRADAAANDPRQDRRLQLLFVCAHPAIAPEIRAPLMVQTVFGLDADRIGQAFLVPGPTIGQRLSRAKTKIRDAGIPFDLPDIAAHPDRLKDVLDALYTAFSTGWEEAFLTEASKADCAPEALYLARLVASAYPQEAEPLGLLSLILSSDARRAARRKTDGTFVPLPDQDKTLWHAPQLKAAERALEKAASLQAPGRFQTEAAIQSFHVSRAYRPEMSLEPLLGLYDVLCARTGSLGARIGRAILLSDLGRGAEGLKTLGDLPERRVLAHQPYWVARAFIASRLGLIELARESTDRALLLTKDPAVRAHLQRPPQQP